MNALIALTLFACSGGAADSGAAPSPEPPLADAVVDALSMERVRDHVDWLAADELAGRTPGSLGHAQAREYLAAEMGEIGLTPWGADGSFELPFALNLGDTRYAFDETGAIVQIEVDTGWNLGGLIPGSDPALAHEHIVVMAHYDHLGVTTEGEIYNGAFDDITAVAALLELARVFIEHGVSPKRSVLFLITDSEEGGLHGSAAWLEDAGIDLDDIVFGISLDPIGRPVLPDYWPAVLIGAERAPTLQARWRELAAFAEMDVGFVNRASIPIFGSDQDSFYLREDPLVGVWFTSPGMTWYHTTDDTAETIDYRGVRDQLRFFAHSLAWFGDSDERYADHGAQDLSTQDAADAAAITRGALGSTHLTDDERFTLEGFLSDLDDAAAGESDLADLNAVYVNLAFYLMFDITTAHPGEIPPPFPE